MKKPSTDKVRMIEAAAGTGKTTCLAQEYLTLLEKFDPDRIVAITFTRKAAAELVERVSNVLWAVQDGSNEQQHHQAKAALGKNIELYRKYAPKDPEKIRHALGTLPDAPIGTTDSFIRRLLSENVLDALLPISEKESILLDYPIGEESSNARDVFEQTAREIVAHPAGQVRDDVRLLLEWHRISDLVERLSDPIPAGVSSKAPCSSRALFETLMKAFLVQHATDEDTLRNRLLAILQEQECGPQDLESIQEKIVKKMAHGGPVKAVSRWLSNDAEPMPPMETLLFLNALKSSNSDNAPRKRMIETLKTGWKSVHPDEVPPADILFVEVAVGVQPVRVPFSRICGGTPMPTVDDPAQEADLERVRAALVSLHREVSTEALRRAASQASLGYGEYLEAATALILSGKSAVCERYNALLVDEVQDSSPDQIEFFSALIRKVTTIEQAIFVGDKRQSIYLFNGADPAGMDTLREGFMSASQTPRRLDVNHRSTANLIGAQQLLFGKDLTASAQNALLYGLDEVSPDTLKAPDGKEAGLDFPVTICQYSPQEINPPPIENTALSHFADMLETRWKQHSSETAAVLSTKWNHADSACNILNAYFRAKRMGECAHLDRNADWKSSRVVKDLIIVLTALSDRSNHVAWLGMWKLPFIGLSDQAIVDGRFDNSVGDEGWLKMPGWLIDRETLPSSWSAADRCAFEAARAPLRKALNHVTARPLVEVIDTLSNELGWRAILAHAVDPDATVALDLALEWIRELEAAGMSASQIAAELVSDKPAVEPPRLEAERKGPHVICTTIYQAKGLAYDHVFVMEPGEPLAGGGSTASSFPVRIGEKEFQLYPLAIDLDAALGTDSTDPVGRFAAAVHKMRTNEEALRLAYVAITRARQSAMVYVETPDSKKYDQPHFVLRSAWVVDTRNGKTTVSSGRFQQYVEFRTVTPVFLPSAFELATVTRAGDFQAPKMARTEWRRRSPSSLANALSADDRKAIAESVTQRAVIEDQRFDLIGPPKGDIFQNLHENDFGTLVHGWFETWKFNGRPTIESAKKYVKEQWRLDENEHKAIVDAAADWLIKIAETLQSDPDAPLWKLVAEKKSKLHFEMPITGVATMGDASPHPFLLTGMADLIVERADGWTLVDFKAGKHAPKLGDTGDALIKNASLDVYVPQLEGYARSINNALAASKKKERITQAALWYVRSGASVMWKIK